MIDYQKIRKYAIEAYKQFVKAETKKELFEAFTASLSIPERFKPVLEAINEGVVAILEADTFAPYKKICSEIMNGIVAEFQNKGGRELTRILMGVIRGESGCIQVKPIGGFGLVSEFIYKPTCAPTERDKEAAKGVLISSVFPLIIKKAIELSRRTKDEEAGHDFILGAMEKLPGFVERFEYRDSSFLNAFLFEMRNLERDLMAKASGISSTARYWKKGARIEKGTIYSYSGQNYRALDGVSDLENIENPSLATHLFDPVGTSKRLTKSLDQGQDGDEEVGIHEKIPSTNFTSDESEQRSDLSRLLEILPQGKERAAIEMYFGIGVDRLSDFEISERLKISRTNVHYLIKKGVEKIRSKAKL